MKQDRRNVALFPESKGLKGHKTKLLWQDPEYRKHMIDIYGKRIKK